MLGTNFDHLEPSLKITYGECVATAGEMFSYRVPVNTLGFSRVSVLFIFIFIPVLLLFWTNNFGLSDDGRLYPYKLCQEVTVHLKSFNP